MCHTTPVGWESDSVSISALASGNLGAVPAARFQKHRTFAFRDSNPCPSCLSYLFYHLFVWVNVDDVYWYPPSFVKKRGRIDCKKKEKYMALKEKSRNPIHW